jgi:hypothetical protein
MPRVDRARCDEWKVSRARMRLRAADPETQSYVADILGLLAGAGGGGLMVRLVR